jgi:hypothetical protein
VALYLDVFEQPVTEGFQHRAGFFVGFVQNTGQGMKVGKKDVASIRQSDFAGSWYPGEESDCLQVIEEFTKTTAPCLQSEKPMVGGIVPHAGWYYSGKIACHVIKCLKTGTTPDSIVLLEGIFSRKQQLHDERGGTPLFSI